MDCWPFLYSEPSSFPLIFFSTQLSVLKAMYTVDYNENAVKIEVSVTDPWDNSWSSYLSPYEKCTGLTFSWSYTPYLHSAAASTLICAKINGVVKYSTSPVNWSCSGLLLHGHNVFVFLWKICLSNADVRQLSDCKKYKNFSSRLSFISCCS